MKNKLNIKAWAWLIAGIILVCYYFIESLFVGFTFSLLWLWCAGGLVCILFSLLTFKHGKLPIPKWMFVTACIILSIIFVIFCVLEGFVISQMDAVGKQGLDYIIVLGAKINRNGVPSKPLYWRIDAAEEYLIDNPDTIAVLSGGKGNDEPISEAQCMYNELVQRGISRDRLIIEENSTSTNENIRFTLDIIGDDAEFGIVTNNFHVFRAVRIAEKVTGRAISGVASHYKDALIVHYMAREAIGILKDTIQNNMDIFY